jgi:hypothetical protein
LLWKLTKTIKQPARSKPQAQSDSSFTVPHKSNQLTVNQSISETAAGSEVECRLVVYAFHIISPSPLPVRIIYRKLVAVMSRVNRSHFSKTRRGTRSLRSYCTVLKIASTKLLGYRYQKKWYCKYSRCQGLFRLIVRYRACEYLLVGYTS